MTWINLVEYSVSFEYFILRESPISQNIQEEKIVLIKYKWQYNLVQQSINHDSEQEVSLVTSRWDALGDVILDWHKKGKWESV